MNTPAATPEIELIFDSDCPNVAQARDVLQQALRSLHLDLQWQEWERSDPACPEYARAFGSPSILVNHKDVSPAAGNDNSCCRLYPENSQFQGCPSVASIVNAIKNA